MWDQVDAKQSVGKSVCGFVAVSPMQFTVENASLKTAW